MSSFVNLHGLETFKNRLLQKVFGAATSASAGSTGVVPAPAAGDQNKFLKADGTWENPPGTKPITFELDTVTNTSGSYTHTTLNELAVASMKPLEIICSNPEVFGDSITVSITDGSITLSCDSVSGTSDVSIIAMKQLDPEEGDPPIMTSTEFDILNNRIGGLTNLTTTSKTSAVSAINEVNAAVTNLMNVAVDIPFTIATTDWSQTSPYTYTYLDNRVTAQCSVDIQFLRGVTADSIPLLEYEKVTGGVQFTIDALPSIDIPINMRIINVQTQSINSVTGNMVATSVISGAVNADEALTSLQTNKLDKTSVVNDLITTTEGSVLDARQGKVLSDQIATDSTLLSENTTNCNTCNLRMFKFGALRILTGYVNMKSTGAKTVCTLSASDKPRNSINFTATRSGINNVAQCDINASSGDFSCNSPITDANLFFNASWIV